MDNNKIIVSDLDFDNIKENLKLYLQGQAEFSDYNFEGSTLSILLDLLAYNTHYNGYYLNMVFNETFLDTAVKRSSVVSRAKELGYTPASIKAATALINIELSVSNNPVSIVLPRGTRFTATDRTNNQYAFVTAKPYITKNINGEYKFNNVELKEGLFYSYSYTVDLNSNPKCIFELPNSNIDISTLQVRVKNSTGSSTYSVYTHTNSISEVTGSSKVFFVQENYLGKMELYFGNNVIGKKLSTGNVIDIDYIITSGGIANGVSSFSITGDSVSGYPAIITTAASAYGGAEAESIEQIKFNAPKSYLSQNRAVTAMDFDTTIRNLLPDIETLKVWGGEENDPPQYGKVFISLKPVSGYNYPTSFLEQTVRTVLSKKALVTTQFEFVPLDYLYVTVNSVVTFDPYLTTTDVSGIHALVESTIVNYFDNELEKFDANMYYSKLLNVIDSSDPSIISNLTTLGLQKRVKVTLNSSTTHTVKFGNKLVTNSIRSSNFNIAQNGVSSTVYFKDISLNNGDNTGSINVYSTENNQLVKENIGTVYYSTGVVIFTTNVVDANNIDNLLYINVLPMYNDVFALRNSLITYNNSSNNTVLGISSGINVTVGTGSA
jgi:hypothetical protein